MLSAEEKGKAKAIVKERSKWMTHQIKSADYIGQVKARQYGMDREKLRVSKMLPVRLDGMVVNYLVYERMLKKLKGFRVEVLVHELPQRTLRINFQNERNEREGGRVELYDISHLFSNEQIKELPELQLERV